MDSRIKSCVENLMGDSEFKPQADEDKKTAAIRVCKKSISRSKEFRKQLS
jgi:hypothetical protein